MKKTKLLTSLAALALVACLGACESGDIYIDMGGVDIGGSSSDTTDTETSETDESSSSTGTTPDDDDPSVNNPTTTYDYSITYEGNGYVFAYILPDGANEGDSVYFKLLTESGYSIDSVYASYKDADLKDVAIALSGDAAAGYTFTMPAADVAIKASAVGAYFKLTYDTETPVFVDNNDEYYDATDFIDGFYELGTDTKIGEGSGLYFQAGSQVLVVAKHLATATNLRIYANGEKLELVEDEDLNAGFYAYLLTMPAKDCQLTFDADLQYVNITLEGNDKVDAYLYTDSTADTTSTRLEKVYVNDTSYYIHAEVKDEYYSQYDIGKVTISWTEFSSKTTIETEEKSVTTEWDSRDRTTDDANFGFIDNDTKVALVPDTLFASNELTITFELADAGQYKGQLFVGNWTGYEFYNENKYGSLVNTVIDGNGTMTSSTNTSNLNGVTVSSITNEGYAVLSDGRTFYTDGKIAYLLFSSSTSTCSDVWVLAKDAEDITLDFYAPSGKMHVIRVFDKDGNYLSALYANEDDEASVKYYVGVTIEFLDDTTSLSQAGATFAVKDSSGNQIYSREAIYRDSSFVGTWVGYEFKNQSKTGSLVNTTLAATGDVTGSVSYLNDLTIESVTDNGCPVLSDGRTFYTDGNVAIIYASPYSSSASDVYVLGKGVDDISFDFYAVSNTNYVIRVLDENGTYLGALYVDDANSTKFYAGVNIEFTDGSTSLAEAGSTFIVTDANGNELFSRQPKYAADAPFIGTWAPSNFYSGSSHSVVSTFTIDVMGDITGNSTFSSYSVSSVSDDGYDVVLTSGSSSKTFYTDGKVGIMYYSGSCNDSWVCAKGYDTFTQDYWTSSNYLWLDILKDSSTGEVIGALFADSDLSPDIYAGVTIEYITEGETLASSTFKVIDRNGNLLYTKS